jgi:hypothetical protein
MSIYLVVSRGGRRWYRGRLEGGEGLHPSGSRRPDRKGGGQSVPARHRHRDTLPMIDKLNPTTVHEPAGYNHVTISNVGRLAHLAGQCPLDRSGEVVGKPGDYAAQTKQVITNCLAVLEPPAPPRRRDAVGHLRGEPGQRCPVRGLATTHHIHTGQPTATPPQ